MTLKDVYFQTPIHPASRKYLRLAFLDTVFQFRVLPFGISMALWLFTKVVSVGKDLFHRDRLSLVHYQLVGRCPNQVKGLSKVTSAGVALHSLGAPDKPPKIRARPYPIFNFVGMTFNLCLGMVFVAEKNLAKVITAGSDCGSLW